MERSLYPQGKSPWCPLDRRLDGPQRDMVAVHRNALFLYRSVNDKRLRTTGLEFNIPANAWSDWAKPRQPSIKVAYSAAKNRNEYLLNVSLTDVLTPWCRTLFKKLIVTQLIEKYPAFSMEPEGSLPYPQKPTTRPYPEPAESSSPIDFYLPKVRLNIILPPTPRSTQWSLNFGPPNQKPVNIWICQIWYFWRYNLFCFWRGKVWQFLVFISFTGQQMNSVLQTSKSHTIFLKLQLVLFLGKDCGKIWQFFIKIVSSPAENRTRYFQIQARHNISLKVRPIFFLRRD